MNDAGFPAKVMQDSYAARAALAGHPAVGRFVDASLPIPKPFRGTGRIRLAIIGQDPTVQDPKVRLTVETVLMLDQTGHLRRYVETLCEELGVSLAENVYATNACKSFFSAPPTTIQREHGVDVLAEGKAVWLPLLRRELAEFPGAAAISLGEPVLTMLVHESGSRLMRHYWGYDVHWKRGVRKPMRPVSAEESTVGRPIFPFPHQRTMSAPRARFYRTLRPVYVAHIRQSIP